MRILTLFIGLLLLAFIFGCATGPSKVTEEPAEKTAEEPEVEKEAEPQAEAVEEAPEPITVIIDLLQKESSYYADGVLDEYIIITYQEGSTDRDSRERFNDENQLQERWEYIYENDLLKREENYNGAGELQKYHVYDYDNQGNVILDAMYDEKDELQSKSEYEYDGTGNKVLWEVYGGNGALLSTTKYIYENGLNTRIETYTPAGELSVYFEIEYENGNPVKKAEYSADGEPEGYSTFVYRDGAMVEKTIHRANDSVQRKVLYENNKRGNPVHITYTNASGTVQEKIEREYKQYETIEYRE